MSNSDSSSDIAWYKFMFTELIEHNYDKSRFQMLFSNISGNDCMLLSGIYKKTAVLCHVHVNWHLHNMCLTSAL